MTRTTRRWRTTRRVGSVVALFVLLGSPSAQASSEQGGSDHASRAASDSHAALSLTGSITAAGSTWVTLDMGKSDAQHDLFWQLFTFHSAGTEWVLVTPPGVADNGGLVVTSGPKSNSALAGFGPSQALTFSPLAITTTGGAHWGPGGLPTALVTVPSSLALGSGSRALALVGGSSQKVLSTAGALTAWRPLVTLSRFATTSSGRRCDVVALRAVALSAQDEPLLGASCRKPGFAGIFAYADGEWNAVPTALPRSLEEHTFDVLRLTPSSALLAADEHGTTSLIASWQGTAGRPWAVSPALPLAAGTHLLASGSGPGNTWFVVVADNGQARAEVNSGPGSSWQTLSSLPAATASIAFEPDGRIDAFVVNDAHLSIWRLSTETSTWTKVQSLVVPIAFGSSA